VKPLDEQDHYEVLEVAEDASPADIERAYRMISSTYSQASQAVYSMLDGADLESIRVRIDQAYGVLADSESRRDYDAARRGTTDPVPEAVQLSIGLPASPQPGEDATPDLEGFETLDAEAESAVFDGPRLRRARLRRGLEIDEIARITKVSPTYLHFLEQDQMDGLPAPVYVRGFVKAFARCVGIDADAAARGYMEHFAAARGDLPPRWFRGKG
jgi:flagellar biosynthesis protein FlhG